ncbi:MAG: hypothetical protein FJ147_17200 [Deltaproteobacteria bacterium]|nr:hypothetical protein [Deltaproteobacteria bacterium]
MNTVIRTTLLELVQVVSEYAQSDAEVVATVVSLINSGQVSLCGNFAGARINLSAGEQEALSAWPVLQV